MELKEFTEYLVKSIAKEPEMVKVQQFGGEDESTILEIIDDIVHHRCICSRNPL